MTLAMKIVPRFPARVDGSGPITVTKENGVYTIAYDLSGLAAFDLDDATTSFITIYDADTGTFGKLTIQALIDEIGTNLDPVLASLIGASDGILVKNGSDIESRTVTGTANEITVTNGSGVAGNPTISLPAAITLTGKTVTGGTFSAPAISSPTGLVKADVGLGNVDNTSDATKNSAVATLTNKTLTAPVINSPTGLVKADVGLGNVDNTSDATKNAASVTLTNKTISGASNTLTNIANSSLTNSSMTIAGTLVSLGGSMTIAASALTNGVTGSGAIVLATSPTLVTPALGTPSAVVLTNGTGLPVATGVKGREIQIKVIDDVTTLTTGDNKCVFMVPASLNGLDLLSAHAGISSQSSSGTPTIQLRNITNGNVDMLSTRITIDANENTSYTAATPHVVNTSNDNVTTGDLIAIDVDVAGTGAGGLIVDLVFG